MAELRIMSLFCVAVGAATVWCSGSLHNAGYFAVLAAVHGSLGLSSWRLFRAFTLLSPFSHSSPSLIGLLASVDIKQQSLSLSLSLSQRMYLWWYVCALCLHACQVRVPAGCTSVFMYLVFTRMPGGSYHRRLRSLLLYLC